MNWTPVPEPATTPAPEASPPPRSLGGLLELTLFLLLGGMLYFLVQIAALLLLVYSAQQQQPHIPWDVQMQRIAQQVQYDVLFIVPVQMVFYLLVFVLLYALVRGLRGLPFWSSLAFRSLPSAKILRWLGAGIALAFVVQISSLYVPPPEPIAFDRLFTSKTAAWTIVAMSVLVAPLIEELVFRGYVYTALEPLWGKIAAVLVSGLLFGAIHIPQLYPGVFQMLLLGAVGIVFSAARAHAGTVFASIVLHLGYNGTISTLFVLSPQFRALPAAFF